MIRLQHSEYIKLLLYNKELIFNYVLTLSLFYSFLFFLLVVVLLNVDFSFKSLDFFWLYLKPIDEFSFETWNFKVFNFKTIYNFMRL